MQISEIIYEFSKLMLKSRSTAKIHKSLSRLSDIVLRVVVFISFILLNVLSHVVDETGSHTVIIRDIIVGNPCFTVIVHNKGRQYFLILSLSTPI